MLKQKKLKTNCITFAPFLKELNGHVMDYHLSLHRLFQKKGWETTTLLSTDCALENLPSNWKKKLFSPVKWSRHSVLAKAFPVLLNWRKFSKMVRSLLKAISPLIQKDTGHKTVLFLETFNTFHLYALAFILPFVPIKNVHLWILYRYDSKQLFFKGKKDRRVLKFLSKVLPKRNLTLLADTDKLVAELTGFFKRKIHLVPIPHTANISQEDTTLGKKTHFCMWWPGVPRRPKGLHSIQKMCSFCAPEKSSIVLRVSEKTPHLKTPENFTIQRIRENLDRTDYLNYLKTSDVILMPYNLWNYRYSSSGIFVETIVANKLPIVAQGLWISEELQKYNLSELILNFEDPKLLFEIQQLLQSEEVLLKLKAMSEDYQEFHNEKNFASHLLCHI